MRVAFLSSIGEVREKFEKENKWYDHRTLRTTISSSHKNYPEQIIAPGFSKYRIPQFGYNYDFGESKAILPNHISIVGEWFLDLLKMKVLLLYNDIDIENRVAILVISLHTLKLDESCLSWFKVNRHI